MKTATSTFKPFSFLIAAITLLFIFLSVIVFAQDKSDDQVKVKIVKIVDGKTTTIEKTMSEASVKDFTKQFEDIKGKNVQVMITVEGNDKEKRKEKHASSMNFNFNMDSSTAHAFSKVFSMTDSSMTKSFAWNDSMMKNLPKNFDFNFDFDDEGEMNNFDFNINTDEGGKNVIITNKNGKKIVINGDEDNVTVSSSESNKAKTKTKTKTIVINGDKHRGNKKVIVSTSVQVIDMDDEGGDKTRKSDKEESTVNFYPNPSDGNFTLDVDLNGKEDAMVRITDINGKEVYNEKITGSGKTSKSINLGSDKRGTFIVTIKQGKKTTSKKIIIE